MTSGPFDDVRLPVFIEQGAKGGPGFNTTIKDLASGREKRNQNWSRSRARWDIGYAIDDFEGMRPVLAFFYARRGRARAFRFRDWADYELPRQTIGVGDAVHRVFPIFKRYEDDGGTFDRPITRPVRGTIRVWVDGAEQELLPEGWEPLEGFAAATLAAEPTVYARLDPTTLEIIGGAPAPLLIGLDGLTLALQDQGGKAGGAGLRSDQTIADGKRMFEVTTNPAAGANAYGRDSIIVGLGTTEGTGGGISYFDGNLFAEDGSLIVPDPPVDFTAQPLCLGFAIDHDVGQVHIHANGVRFATTPSTPGRPYRLAAGVVVNAEQGAPSARLTVNFGACAFTHPIEDFKGVYTGADPGEPGGNDPDSDPERPMPPAGTVAVDADTGQVLFGTAPAEGSVIEAACEFDLPVRFDTDDIEQQLMAGQYSSIPSIPILEIKE